MQCVLLRFIGIEPLLLLWSDILAVPLYSHSSLCDLYSPPSYCLHLRPWVSMDVRLSHGLQYSSSLAILVLATCTSGSWVLARLRCDSTLLSLQLRLSLSLASFLSFRYAPSYRWSCAGSFFVTSSCFYACSRLQLCFM